MTSDDEPRLPDYLDQMQDAIDRIERYVSDGEKNEPYVETDAPNPLGAYGRSKLAGERAIAASGADHLVFWTSWVYATTA